MRDFGAQVFFVAVERGDHLGCRLAAERHDIDDGKLVEVSVANIVPDDLIELRAGDLIPADATLRPGNTLSVDEAALTGESMFVQKHAGTGPEGR